MHDNIIKYPRTPHIEGSKLQKGDTDEGQISLKDLLGHFCVLEEKMDGANCGISFSREGELRLQSRGHFLTGGAREKHFNLLKEWAMAQQDMLFDLLGDRYVCFGEWMYAKHSVFYDKLPHFFLEFDFLDKTTGLFLSTQKRLSLIGQKPIVSVPVLWSGVLEKNILDDFVGCSVGRSQEWQDNLKKQGERLGQNTEKIFSQTDPHSFSEGLYIKVEENDHVVGRYKYIRHGFCQTILEQNEHWLRRPITPNLLREGQDIYAPTIDKTWQTFVPAPKPKRKP